ncbi:hypothetical protein NC653_001232 [Populus alba x Populus x berolinensis]|uniref:Thaumatin-like protein n=1 Tax=Populus alba x Populus x berolinensis TaxID=444605 RepID=A0AAD6RLI8_9ROSI|nr:hypothetical protein NC653_001232 [Populus alba x Populus x berolinensis]
MSSLKALSIFSFLFAALHFPSVHAATFDITNKCPYTVWAAAVPGGGRQLNNGQKWTISAAPGTTHARIWARTNCKFDGAGRGSCQTGDCNGLLACQGYGSPPNTLAEYAIGQYANQDYIDISNIDGFNVPMEFSSASAGCTRVINAATFEIRNSCPYTVWAAASPGGGRRLERGQTWNLNVPAGTSMARIWGRTNCNFDGGGQGRCQTGDCTGGLQCKGWGVPPNTLAEYALNQFGNLDFYDISLVDGFNIPIEFSPKSGGGSGKCQALLCTADINGQCPNELRAPGGCNNPCSVFKTNKYCCTNGQGSCGPTNFSRFFKDRCPTSYSYPQDDPSSTFTCPGGTNYRVIFCPRGSPHFPLEMVEEKSAE